MKKEQFFDKSVQLADKALSNLKSKQIPPIPKYFQEEFSTLLHQNIDNNQLNDQTVANSLGNHNNFLEIAEHALNAFMESYEQTATIMGHQRSFLGTPTLDEKYVKENAFKIIDSLSLMDTQMVHLLQQAQERINTLKYQLDQAKKDNLTDPLTKLFNRRALIHDITKCCGDLREREGERRHPHEVHSTYLLMIDLDDFKQINDVYGHIAGDKTLIFIARTIWALIRETDTAYRFGGDELVVLLRDCTLEDAQKISEKIRSTIEKSHLIYESHQIIITVSIGISPLLDGYETTLIKADHALYQAKKSGKNAVYLLAMKEEF